MCILLLLPSSVFLPQFQMIFELLFSELPCIQIPQNQAVKMLNVDPIVLESPQKFFLRVKQKLQQKQQQKGT